MQIPLDYNVPSTFKVEYDYKPTTAGSTSSVLWIGESTSKALLFGRIGGNDSTYQVWARNGSSDLKTTGSSIVASSDFKHLFITYDGTSVNFNDDITVTNLNGVALSKIVQVSGYHYSNDGQIKNIKIKPL